MPPASPTKSKLAQYRTKRNFARTSEPRGKLQTSASKLRFVIQRHDATHLHYDFRLELDNVLKSWAVTRGPSLDPHNKRLAVEVEDHPLDYGDFEGIIPKGQYGGGTVQLWDRGYWIPEGDPHDAMKCGNLKFSLQGKRLQGDWVLVRMNSDRMGSKRNNWLLIKHRDAYARDDDNDALLKDDKSIASGRSINDIAAAKGKKPTLFFTGKPAAVKTSGTSKKNYGKHNEMSKAKDMPNFIEPQLCKLVQRPTSEPGWAHEVKFDGYRVQLRVENDQAQLRTRKGLDWTTKFAAIAKTAASLPDCLLDGEIVALDKHGAPDFAALQAALSEGTSEKLIFFAFDLLFLEGQDLRSLPLRDRKAQLKTLIDKPKFHPHLHYVEHFETAGDAVLKSACRMHLEGIVSKRLESPYTPGRGFDWTKTKCRGGQEIVIAGWTSEEGQLRSLLAGVYRGNTLVYVGRVGTGFTLKTSRQLMASLKKIERNDSPFPAGESPPKQANVHWAKPELAAEIEFTGWTTAGMLRQAAFKGLRQDKPADEVEVEKPAKSAAGPEIIMGVSITNPDKPLWPNETPPITKGALARYYETVGDWLIEHIKDRPCSILRTPDGIDGEKFFQRHAMAGLSNLFELVKVTGDHKPYLELNRVEALAAVAQLGAVELHPWNCQAGEPNLPGRLVFDLDPAPDLPFDRVIKAAIELRNQLAEVGLTAFCKTTGGKGLHIVANLASDKNSPDWSAAKAFAREICRRLTVKQPEFYTITMTKTHRDGRIYLDYLRNDRMATAVAPLSPRARDGAPVSMPIDWPQVRTGLDPSKFTVRTVPLLLKKHQPWKEYAKSAKPLRQAIEQLLKTK